MNEIMLQSSYDEELGIEIFLLFLGESIVPMGGIAWVCTPMDGFPTIAVTVYALFEGLPKLKVKPFILEKTKKDMV